MKHSNLTLLLTVLMSMVGVKAFADHIAVPNADGVTIYYNIIYDGTELLVTYRGIRYSDYSNEYSGNVVIPEEVNYMNRIYKVTRIDSHAFEGCSALTTVTIPNSVTSIGNYAFYQCSGLTSVTIGNSVTSIGNYAFYQCSGLTSVTIPNSVTSIGYHAFDDCSGLKKVIVKDIAAWCGIEFGFRSNPLYYSRHLYSDEDTEITNLVIPNSVTSIGYLAFEGCSGLTSVTIPNSVTSIGSSAFSGCSGLTSVTIPNSVTSIGDSAFSYCSGLNSVTIGNNVKNIGDWAFFGCSELNSVTSLIEHPFVVNIFDEKTKDNAKLYVPKGSMYKYQSTKGWDFRSVMEGKATDINTSIMEQKTEVERYSFDGKLITEPKRGLNIIKMNDGTTKKVLVK